MTCHTPNERERVLIDLDSGKKVLLPLQRTMQDMRWARPGKGDDDPARVVLHVPTRSVLIPEGWKKAP